MNKLLKLASCIVLITFLFTQAGLADTIYYYHTDPSGTPLAMTDASGSVVWKADYKPFGEEWSVTANIENNKEFVGKEKDTETGLSYFGARYMSSNIGRFISTDPVGPVNPATGKINQTILNNPQRLNLYSYGLNNPYKYVDINGESAIFIDIERRIDTDKSIIGTLKVNFSNFGVTLELPYDENKAFISSIPTGTHFGKFVNSPTKGKTIEIIVEGRKYILFHTGNEPKDTEGCVLVGTQIADKDLIEGSKNAFKKFKDFVYGIKNIDKKLGEPTDILINVKDYTKDSE